jgi:hypothetical protein
MKKVRNDGAIGGTVDRTVDRTIVDAIEERGKTKNDEDLE